MRNGMIKMIKLDLRVQILDVIQKMLEKVYFYKISRHDIGTIEEWNKFFQKNIQNRISVDY